jgi:transposase
MPGQYPTRGAVRPRVCDEAQQADATGRFFLCARCRAQVLICSCCDRGNIYCEQDWAQRSRREAQREAGRRYQSSHRGRRDHAERARAYRTRQNKVTHQGSPQQPTDNVIRKCAAVEVSASSGPSVSTPPDATLVSTASTLALLLLRTSLRAVRAQRLLAKRTRSATIAPELEAQILRYHHVVRWRPGTIAKQLRVHPDTFARVLAQAGLPRIGAPARPSRIDPYLPFILQTLEKFPRLTASRLHAMVRERGYSGGPDHFRHVVSRHRPRPKAEAYLRLRTLPGERAQVDWAHFGRNTIRGAIRPLMAFVMVLSYSRALYLRFFLNASLENFLRGHLGAFATRNGSARALLYDNLKSVVLERQGDAIRFHPTLLEFAAHYRFEPRPVAIARGNEKGRVERAARDAFFAGRAFADLADLNAQANAWCQGMAADRRCPGGHSKTVREALAEEGPRLLALPDNPYPLYERLGVIARNALLADPEKAEEPWLIEGL